MDVMCKNINDLMAALQELRHGADTSAGVSTTPGTRMSYCWSHGTMTGLWHTSENCHKQKKGHKKEATFYNKMG
eukprot:11862315-Ditylum_brightwellii.AAC.2